MPQRALPVLALLLAALACNTPAPTEPPPTPTAQLGTSETVEPITPSPTPQSPTSPPAASPTAFPTAEGPPAFTEIAFTTEPDTPTRTTQFEEGVQEVFAVFRYENMQPGMTIRREWYNRGALWVQVEEPWDVEEYGVEGVRGDISIFDYEDYLPPGSYTVQFYINDQPQFDNNGATFFIQSDGIAEPTTTADGSRKATVSQRTTLVVDGDPVLQMPAPIESMAWFPDGEHMALALLSNAAENDGQGFFLAENTLYVVNVGAGEIVSQVGTAEESFSQPAVSPDGRWIAAVGGSGFGDACIVDSALGFIELDENFQRVAAYTMRDLALFDAQAGIHYPINDDGLLLPGTWVDATTFRSAISLTCPSDDDTPAGIYTFDVPGQSAQRTGDIQEP